MSKQLAKSEPALPLFKTCTSCKKSKSLDQFYRDRSKKSGRGPRCSDCGRQASSAYQRAKYSVSADFRAKKQARSRRSRTNRWLHYLVYSAASRAARRKIKFNLDETWIEQHKDASKCALTGVTLKPGAERLHGAPNPLAPSLDRINPKKGYVKGNVRIVCQWANMSKSTLTDSELRLLVLSAASFMKQ